MDQINRKIAELIERISNEHCKASESKYIEQLNNVEVLRIWADLLEIKQASYNETDKSSAELKNAIKIREDILRTLVREESIQSAIGINEDEFLEYLERNTDFIVFLLRIILKDICHKSDLGEKY